MADGSGSGAGPPRDPDDVEFRRDELRRRIRETLEQREESPRHVSLAIGLSPNTISKFLKKTTRELSPDTCQRLARYFHWDPDEILMLAGHRREGPPREAADPLSQLARFLLRYGWSEEARETILRVARMAPPGRHPA